MMNRRNDPILAAICKARFSIVDPVTKEQLAMKDLLPFGEDDEHRTYLRAQTAALEADDADGCARLHYGYTQTLLERRRQSDRRAE